jgi:hypothetical protein
MLMLSAVEYEVMEVIGKQQAGGQCEFMLPGRAFCENV